MVTTHMGNCINTLTPFTIYKDTILTWQTGAKVGKTMLYGKHGKALE